jgi:hypothetical protein
MWAGYLASRPGHTCIACVAGNKMRPNLFGPRSPSASSARAALAPSGLRNHAHSPPRACRPQRDALPSTKMPGAEVSVTSRFSLRVPTLSMSRCSGSSPPCLVSSSRDRRRIPLYTLAKHCDRRDRRNKGRPVAVACRHPGPCLLCMNRLAFTYYRSRVQSSSFQIARKPSFASTSCRRDRLFRVYRPIWLHNCPPDTIKPWLPQIRSRSTSGPHQPLASKGCSHLNIATYYPSHCNSYTAGRIVQPGTNQMHMPRRLSHSWRRRLH